MNTITLKQAQAILKVLRKMDPSAQMHTDYSGKFMWGAKCLGYSANNAAIVGSGLAMVLSTYKDIDLLEILEDSRSDSLARQEIAYFPLLQVEG
jgi:hypothetical protein